MKDKEFIAVLKELLSQMRTFNTEIKSINESLDNILRRFKNFEAHSPFLQESLVR